MPRSSPWYEPDDGGIALESLDFLHSEQGKPLREAAFALFANAAEPPIAAIERLKKSFSNAGAPTIRAALTLARLQPKGLAKFPGQSIFWGVPEALEQASHLAVARWKARRIAQKSGAAPTVVDLCAGIGGDALALAERASRLIAVELSPVRARCLEFNARERHLALEVLVGDLGTFLPQLPSSALFHIDPARRAAGRRSARYEDLLPGPEVLGKVIRHFPIGGAIKLSPAVDFETLPPGHLELISHDRTVVQAVLWMGTAFAAPGRTATILTGTDVSFTFSAMPCATSIADALLPTPFHLYEVDGAMTRAGLAAPLADSLNLACITHDGGYVQGADDPLRHPALSPFLIGTVVPYSEKKVAQILETLSPTSQRAPGSSAVEVKARGRLHGVDTDELQRRWSASSPTTVLLFEFRGDVFAAIGQRLKP